MELLPLRVIHLSKRSLLIKINQTNQHAVVFLFLDFLIEVHSDRTYSLNDKTFLLYWSCSYWSKRRRQCISKYLIKQRIWSSCFFNPALIDFDVCVMKEYVLIYCVIHKDDKWINKRYFETMLSTHENEIFLDDDKEDEQECVEYWKRSFDVL